MTSDDPLTRSDRCILTSEPPSVLQGPLWPMVPEAILQKWLGHRAIGAGVSVQQPVGIKGG